MSMQTKQQKPLISICLPCYNVSKYLDKLFSTLKNQTFKNFELLFINDGSTDDTYQKILYLVEKYKDSLNCKVYTQKNKGIGATRNELIKKANGEYLFFLDPDDSMPKNALELLYNASDSGNISIIAGRAKFVFNEKWKMPFIPQSRFNKHFNATHYVKSNMCTVWGVLFKKSLFNNDEFLPDYIFEDIGLVSYIFLKNDSFKLIKNIVYFYNRRIGVYSLSSFSEKNRWSVIDLDVQMNQIFTKYKNEGWLDSRKDRRIINGTLFQPIVANLWLAKKYTNNEYMNLLPLYSLYSIYKKFNIKLQFSKTPWKILAFSYIKMSKSHRLVSKIVYKDDSIVSKMRKNAKLFVKLNNQNIKSLSTPLLHKLNFIDDNITNLKEIIETKTKKTFLLDQRFTELYNYKNVVVGETITDKNLLNNIKSKTQFINISKIDNFSSEEIENIVKIDNRILIIVNKKYSSNEKLKNKFNIVFDWN
ncbi:MAG: glycosyltransferase family 2 protein [Mycoplasma sp.]